MKGKFLDFWLYCHCWQFLVPDHLQKVSVHWHMFLPSVSVFSFIITTIDNYIFISKFSNVIRIPSRSYEAINPDLLTLYISSYIDLSIY
jgi:hypothetical protein